MDFVFNSARLSSEGGRSENQDAAGFEVGPEAACWVIADGLGGHRGGALASKTAVEQVLGSFEADDALSSASIFAHVEKAQEAIRSRQEEDPAVESMRTTLVVLVSDYERVLWGHVGDARLYRFRDGEVVLRTRDHSVPQVMAAVGDITEEEIRFHEDRNRLLRALGQEDAWKPQLAEEAVAIERGDAFLLCTDGFWEYVVESEMEEDLAAARDAAQWLDKMEERIAAAAEGEHDNYTAVAVIVRSSAEGAQAKGNVLSHFFSRLTRGIRGEP